MITFVREKYVLRPPDVLVVANNEAFAFLLCHRAELFLKATVVHRRFPSRSCDRSRRCPPTWSASRSNTIFFGTIDQALRWHPRARRLMVVTGTAAPDRECEARLRDEVSRFNDRASAEFLAGLPIAAVLKHLGELGGDAVVFTPGYFQRL